MGFKRKAAVVASGALTAGTFAAMVAALPAGAVTPAYGTEQSAASSGDVFGVPGSHPGSGAPVAGLSTTGGASVEFVRVGGPGNAVKFELGNSNKCVTDGFNGHLTLATCNNSSWQRFDEAGLGAVTPLQNEGSHRYVQDNGRNHQLTTVIVHSHHGHQDFSDSQEWKWVSLKNMGGGKGGGGKPGGGGPVGGKGGGQNGKPVTATATTKITNHPDGGNGTPDPYWADDDFTRVASVKLVGPETTHSNCGATATTCYAYTGTLTDKGTFTTILGAFSPNQSAPYTGDKETRVSHGTMNGSATVTFYASSNHPNAGLVDSPVDNHGIAPAGDLTTTNWVEQFFPSGTTFGGPDLTSWSWTYVTTTPGLHQHWTDALNNGDGNDPSDGNITG